MEAKTLIQLLNYSKTLIQNGELKFLVYRKWPVHPDDAGKAHRSMLVIWEKQLRENPPKSENPERLRKKILGYLEQEKRYGGFVDNMISFTEVNLVFQVLPEEQAPRIRHAYRSEFINLFDNYPSLAHHRFFGAGSQRNWFSNGSETLRGIFPSQFSKTNRLVGLLERPEEDGHPLEIKEVAYLPPSSRIDETDAEVHLSETDTGETVYIITHFPYENTKAIVYVRLRNGLPEVFREEFYYQSESPVADAEGYWLRLVEMYHDFERVKTLNIAFPKARERQEFRSEDGFMRMHATLKIKEMDFNLELPANFFDSDETSLIGDDGKHRYILSGIEEATE